ncbi:MAG: hypothetical protein Q7N50_03910 [Armatimonadota bacterium]|nr:hypothetical protein [Armatimonadota bacterium]
MALLDIWQDSREQLDGKHVQQIIAFAGLGRLHDGSAASGEFREFLSHIPSSFLSTYSAQCLSDKFDDNGLALQDIINEVGRRLEFNVTNGRYRGTSSGTGAYDGLWQSAKSWSIIIEVKTTDAYNINLDKVVDYRRNLIKLDSVAKDKSSVLVIVGRQDTGSLEAQIRGSRHAWDVRLISVDAMFRLLNLKENLEDPAIVAKIQHILIPQEFTKVDGIIDIAFSAAEDVQQEEEAITSDDAIIDDHKTKFTPVSFNQACAKRVGKHINVDLLRKSRATFMSADESVAVVCSVAREQKEKTSPLFWFAFHPYQAVVLGKSPKAYVAFGCGSEERIVLIPYAEFSDMLSSLWITERHGSHYWHVHIAIEGRRVLLRRKKGFDDIDVTAHML